MPDDVAERLQKETRCPRCRTLGRAHMTAAHRWDGTVLSTDWECGFCGHQWRAPIWSVPGRQSGAFL